MVHQHLAHQSCGDPEEVAAPVEVGNALVHHPHVSLVYQHRGLQRYGTLLTCEMMCCQPPQNIVDERDKLFLGPLVPTSPLFQQATDIPGASHGAQYIKRVRFSIPAPAPAIYPQSANFSRFHERFCGPVAAYQSKSTQREFSSERGTK